MNQRGEGIMKRTYLLALAFALLFAGISSAQFPMLDMIADKVIQKYQSSTCEQLWQKRASLNRRWNNKLSRCYAMAANAARFHQPSRGAYRQQDVRMRDDPMKKIAWDNELTWRISASHRCIRRLACGPGQCTAPTQQPRARRSSAAKTESRRRMRGRYRAVSNPKRSNC